MPRPKKSIEDSAPKAKGLFDHINHVREKQDPDYFDKLSDADKKSWSNFMVCRFLSMQPELIDAVNQVQKYSGVFLLEDLCFLDKLVWVFVLRSFTMLLSISITEVMDASQEMIM